MNGETIAMIKALQNKSIENLKTSGGSADAGKMLAVGNDGKITPTNLPVGEGEIALDGTLTIAGAAAGAKETGDAISALNVSLGTLTDDLNQKANANTVAVGFDATFKKTDNSIFAEKIFSSGYISDAGAEGSNSKNARSIYFDVSQVHALQIPLGYMIKFCWYDSSVTFLNRDTDWQQCGYGVINSVITPVGAKYFRLLLVNNDASTITDAARSELNEKSIFYFRDESYADRERSDTLAKLYNRRVSIGSGTPYFTFVKGSDISSSGKAATNTKYARTQIVAFTAERFVLVFPAGFVPAAAFYTNATLNSSNFISKISYRDDAVQWLIDKPATSNAIVFSFHKEDWTDITDNDVATLTNDTLLYVSDIVTLDPITSDDARAAFVTYMNDMCGFLGMSNTTFVNASGLNRDNSSCPLDELKMAIAVTGTPKALDIWSTKNRSFAIGGTNARTINVENNVYGAEPSGAIYKLLGGKGGTLSTPSESYWRKARVAIYDVDGKAVAVALMGPGEWIYNNLYDCTHELLAMMSAKLNGGEPVEGAKLAQLVTNGGGYAATLVPVCSGGYRNSYSPAELINRGYSLHNNDTAQQTPASTTKTMTMLCALNIANDLQEIITLNAGDISSGSGSSFAAGDKITLEDALRIMMMESSNTMAEAIGRFIGIKLLRISRARE